MINAINNLRLRWRGREKTMLAELAEERNEIGKATREQELAVLRQCIIELVDTADGVRPLPLNEASTEKLYKWADRMVRIMDLMVEARDTKADATRGDISLAVIANDLADLADRPFLNDIYDLFKQLANRGRTY